MSDEPRWGPAREYRARPRWRQRQPGRPAEGDRTAGRAGVRPPPRSRSKNGDDDWYDEPPVAAPPRVREAPARPAPPPRGRRRRRGGLGTVALLVLLLAVAYPLALGAVGYAALDRVGPLTHADVADTPGHTVLLVGSDSREGTDLDSVEGSRTDTIMLLHRPAGGGPTVLLSIPRDSYVDIPGQGENKINAAYAFGGPALLTQTVEQATGLHVDSYVETNLGGFAAIVDAVGGVEMCPAEAMQDPLAGLDVPAGCQEMDGGTALAYARTRAGPAGDLGRVQRQRELIAAIGQEAASPATLVNPFQAFPLASSAGSAIAVDDGTGPVDLARFALAFRAVAGADALTLTVPVADTSRRTNAGVVVDWDTDRAAQVFEALRTNDTESIRPIAQEQAAQAGG